MFCGIEQYLKVLYLNRLDNVLILTFNEGRRLVAGLQR